MSEPKEKAILVRSLNVAAIIAKELTQARVGIDGNTVKEYAEAEEAGAILPPIDVFHDGERFYLADGAHRLLARKKRKQTHIDCIVHSGNMRDATIFAACSNQGHGLRRTTEDKRRAIRILLRDREWANQADSVIAKAVGVDHKTVDAVRSTWEIPKLDKLVGKDGLTRRTSSEKRSAGQKQRHDEAKAEPAAQPAQTEPTAPVETTVEERMKAGNTELERIARKAVDTTMEEAREFAETASGKWLDQSRLGILEDQLNGAVENLRRAKGKGTCPHCDGRGCDKCKRTGWLPWIEYESAMGVIEITK